MMTCKYLEVIGKGIVINNRYACHIPICKKTNKICIYCINKKKPCSIKEQGLKEVSDK